MSDSMARLNLTTSIPLGFACEKCGADKWVAASYHFDFREQHMSGVGMCVCGHWNYFQQCAQSAEIREKEKTK